MILAAKSHITSKRLIKCGCGSPLRLLDVGQQRARCSGECGWVAFGIK